ncbi:DoxX family protein [Roseivirga sp. E12]|uniref:DoxX family protein n=1 Tax=Roseivirga sp. E12 TaxID=2819237 RepID=UPI001ABD4321|nr:DoxX family protein [Roseivirga sp. E12]MBO3699161.1 DoxX family protein [Roseivirga sp. E12]
MKRLLKTGKNPLPTNFGLLVFRIAVSLMMFTHGYPKFLKVINGNFQFGDPLGIGPEASLILAAFAEFVCSILLILGLTTRYALVPLMFTMIVALATVHIDDPFRGQEKAFLFLLSYLFLFITGPGKYSLDQKLFN